MATKNTAPRITRLSDDMTKAEVVVVDVVVEVTVDVWTETEVVVDVVVLTVVAVVVLVLVEVLTLVIVVVTVVVTVVVDAAVVVVVVVVGEYVKVAEAFNRVFPLPQVTEIVYVPAVHADEPPSTKAYWYAPVEPSTGALPTAADVPAGFAILRKAAVPGPGAGETVPEAVSVWAPE